MLDDTCMSDCVFGAGSILVVVEEFQQVFHNVPRVFCRHGLVPGPFNRWPSCDERAGG